MRYTAEEQKKPEIARLVAFENALVGNDVATARKMLDEGFKYRRYGWPEPDYAYTLVHIVYNKQVEMYKLLKEHGVDFRETDATDRFMADLALFEHDVAIADLRAELKAARQDITTLAGKVEKLEKAVNPKTLDKPSFPRVSS